MAERKFYGMKNTICSRRFCKVKNTIELGKSVDSKDCVPDVKPVINNSEIVDMEIQVRNEYNWPERSLLYWSRAYDNLKTGRDYAELKKTYHIGILDFTLFEDNAQPETIMKDVLSANITAKRGLEEY